LKDVIIVYFVSLKFFYIGWPFESMLPLLSRYGWLLVVRIDTIQFKDCMLWLGNNRHITWEINHITIGDRKLMCAKVVFISTRGFRVSFCPCPKRGGWQKHKTIVDLQYNWPFIVRLFFLSKVVVRISNIPKGAWFMY
jgi:hypothetical protein